MEVGTVKRQIKNLTLDKFYIFAGEESKVQSIYISKIAEVTKRQIEWVESVSDIYKKTKSLFSLPKCYVCIDDKDFMKQEKVWDTVVNQLGDNMLILIVSDLDKRSKFYKHYADDIVVFEHMPEQVLRKYMKRVVPLSDAGCNYLMKICDYDYSTILLELDKIKLFADANNSNPDIAFKALLNTGAIYIPPEDAIFDFVDAVMFNNPKLAFELYEDCKRIGEPALRLILVLYNTVKKVLQIQSCESKDIEKATGLSTWDIKCNRNKVGCYKTGELVRMMKMFRYVEKSIKTGTMDDSIAMDYILTNIW